MAEKTDKMNLAQKLAHVQFNLKAPKGQYNSFGKYNYRNCEDILEALKPLLKEIGSYVTLSDEPVMLGERFYIKAVAIFTDCADPEKSISITAYAREDESKKGMDAAQVTGSTSSYARKYALNGLFAIDDTKDSDFNNQGKESTDKPPASTQSSASNLVSDSQLRKLFARKKERSVPDDALKQKLTDMGKASSKELTQAEFTKVLKWVEEYDASWEGLGL